MPKLEKVAGLIQHKNISHDGKRAIFEARGDIFSLPAENGVVINLTKSGGTAQRYPAWSPNGSQIAFWSDVSNEYELTIYDVETGEEKQITKLGPGYRYHIFWSPDSKKVAYIDQAMKMWICDVKTGMVNFVDQAFFLYQGGLENMVFSWSSDSKYLAYSKGLENRASAIFIYDCDSKVNTQVTGSYYSYDTPVFDPDGKFLYFFTNQSYNANYSDFDNSWIYENSTKIAFVALNSEAKSPLLPKSDEVKIVKEEKNEKDKDAEKDKSKEKSKENGKEKDKTDDKANEKSVKINFSDFESRVTLLPVESGNYGDLSVSGSKLIYLKREGSKRSLKMYDLAELEESTILESVSSYVLSADGKSILAQNGSNYSIIKAAANQKMSKTLAIGDMFSNIIPKEEWKQIFRDAWRLERDFFYDREMHGVNWQLVYNKYSKLVDQAASRSDVNFLIGEMIGELSSSHTYKGGGDEERSERISYGYLGIDWAIDNNNFKVSKIIKGADWDAEERSPLLYTDIKEGDYILAVNGEKLDVSQDPSGYFANLSGKEVELTYNSKPEFKDAKKVVVKTLKDETRLRHLAWIEKNRSFVDKNTNGDVGYIYVRSTGIDGQDELVRQFYAQWNKKALIIDERFNSGGQIPDRFIELLNRKPLAYFAVRDGKDWQWPPVANFGPKVMMINGWSGSGGGAFPDYFRKAGLGELIGTRTWGGLIGISGAPTLIDGGTVTVPTFRMYNPDGEWFKEGHGVEPDIFVNEDPEILAEGGDAQLSKAVEVILSKLKNAPYVNPKRPAKENR